MQRTNNQIARCKIPDDLNFEITSSFFNETKVHLHNIVIGDAYLTKGWGQFKAILEKRDPGKYVQAKPCTRHSNYQTAYISQMPDSLCPNQGEQDVIILLTLILVNRGHLLNKFKPVSYIHYLPLPSLYIKCIAK